MGILQKTTVADKVLIVSLLAISLIWTISIFRSHLPGQEAEIYTEKGFVSTYPISQNTSINVPGPLGYTNIEIKSGKVRVISSPCPNKLCMHMGKIENAGESIICIPNKVYVIIKGKKRFDSLSY
jgi:hypothetical protein